MRERGKEGGGKGEKEGRRERGRGTDNVAIIQSSPS